ncbi:MAG: 2-amino-4-hydroxy-6-hydroxymethyldihydropteridine diphosphokinase [Amphiplicatus sp.]
MPGEEARDFQPKDMILIALGSNLPFAGAPPAQIMLRALGALQQFGAVEARSRIYRSQAWPDPSDPPFVNAVARFACALGPEALLAALHAVETGFGRRRSAPNAPRTLDLDLLDYRGLIRRAGQAGGLILPHPRIAARDFVLAPLAEIAPDWRHPETGECAASLLAHLGREPYVTGSDPF